MDRSQPINLHVVSRFSNPSLFDDLQNAQDTVTTHATSRPVAAIHTAPVKLPAKNYKHMNDERKQSRTLTAAGAGVAVRKRRTIRGAEKEQGGPDYLSARQLAVRFSVNIATIWRWTNTIGEFSKPIELSPGTTRWAVVEIRAFEQIRRGK